MFSPSPSSSPLLNINKDILPSHNITTLNNNNMIKKTTNNNNNNNNYKKNHPLVDTTTATTTNTRYTTVTDTSIIDTEGDDHESMAFPSSPYLLNDEQFLTPTQILDIITSDINDTTIRQQLKTAIKEFSANYNTQYNTLIQSLKKAKTAHDDLLHELTIQQSHYDKALREMRFYKTKYERLYQLHYQKQQQQQQQQQQQPKKNSNNNNNNMFLNDNDIIDWQRRIASSSNNKSNNIILSPTSPKIRARSQRNRSFASENNESYCGSSSCSSAREWTCSYAQSNIQNVPSFLPNTNTQQMYRHPTDNSNYNDLFYQDENDNNHEEEKEDRVIDLMAVLAMSEQQQQEDISTTSTKSLPLEILGESLNPPAPFIPLPPPPSYPPPTRTASSTETLKKHSLSSSYSSSLYQEQQQNDNNTSNSNSSNEVIVDTTTSSDETPIDPITKNRTMSLTFACGDGFWDTIARGKNNKAEVDSLISNYLRRGGQPNVAKNSSSLKSVKEGYGLIHALIAVKNASALSRIIEAGANPNVITLAPEEVNQTTPLVLAGQLGYLTGIRLLLERAQADIFQRGPRQMTALHAALEKGDDDVALYLIRASKYALLDIVDVEGATPLHYACKYGRIKMMIMFIRDCHAKTDPIDNKGETPLHYAVRQRRLKMITRLIRDFNVYPNHYVLKQTPTPLDLAKSGGFKTISEYLKKFGAKTTKEMEKTAHRGSATTATSSSTKSEKELSVQLSSTSTSTSHISMNDNIPSNNNSGITTTSGVVLGTRISFSSSNISGTTTSSSSSSRRSLANSLSGSASIHSSSNGSTMSRGSVTFSLSSASMNFRSNLFGHY